MFIRLKTKNRKHTAKQNKGGTKLKPKLGKVKLTMKTMTWEMNTKLNRNTQNVDVR